MEQTIEQEEYMGFWIRATAGLIDAAVIMVVGIMIFVAVGISPVPLPTDLPMDLLVYIAYPAYPAYYVALTGLKGQTLGKMAL